MIIINGKFKFGIIGCGSIAGHFCDAVPLAENAEVIAVASKDMARAKALAERKNVALYYDSYETMLKEAKPDAVYIATTHNFHYENIMLCLDYGIPVICEKCMVLTEKQAKEVFERAKEKNVFIMEAMWSRFLPAINKAKSWIKQNKIGSLETANMTLGFKASEDSRLFKPEIAGGAVYDIGVYVIEIISYLIDKKLTDVKSITNYHESGVDKTNNIILRFEDVTANLLTCVNCTMVNNIYIYGTEGYIYIPGSHVVKSAYLFDVNHNEVEKFTFDFENGFEFQIDELIRCVKSNKTESEIIPHKDTIECARIFDIVLNKE